jgi:zinc transport system ATP-binding protein
MLISCDNVSLGYEGHAVVRGINFTVENGDYLLIVGENGSGKSTLIKGLLKLLNPLEGSIVFCDELAGGRIG